MTQARACNHEKTRLIAKDDQEEYVECVLCGAILETRELAGAPPSEAPKPSHAGAADPQSGPFDESLSDA